MEPNQTREPNECVECGRFMSVPPGYDPFERCHECAQKDSDRLSWLEELFEHCPHAVVRNNDDPDECDGRGPIPLGWSIYVSGCYPLDVQAETFRGVIDAGIADSARIEANVAAGRAVDDDGDEAEPHG